MSIGSKSRFSVGYSELKAFLAKRRTGLEQRREARYQTNDSVEVEILQTGFPRLSATIVDISRSGLCVLSDSTIGKGSQVKVTHEKHLVIFGEVQYCRPAQGGFHSGIRIQDVFYPQSTTRKHKESNGSSGQRPAEH